MANVMNPIPSDRMKRKAAKTPEQAAELRRMALAYIGPKPKKRRFADGVSASKKLRRMGVSGKYPLQRSAYDEAVRANLAKQLEASKGE